MSMIEDEESHNFTALEAITMLIAEADDKIALTRKMSELSEMSPEQRKHCENVEVAISVVTAMLNTALPIARFRAFVQVDGSTMHKRVVKDEFTVCSTTIDGIRSGLVGLREYRTNVHVTLWEQRSTGADMLSGYQGPTKITRYRSWLSSLDSFEEAPQVQ
jgi:hypothetical protein